MITYLERADLLALLCFFVVLSHYNMVFQADMVLDSIDSSSLPSTQ